MPDGTTKRDGIQRTDGSVHVNMISGNGEIVDVNNPLPTDGDSIYAKDVDEANSDIGTFTGDILDLFSDYNVEIVDESNENPKIFTVRLLRPVVSNTIGIGSLTGDFSNVKITLKDLAGTSRKVIDHSTDDTKYTSNVYQFTSTVFIEMEVKFYTFDAVNISGMFIPKSQSRNISAIDGIISDVNSSQTPLGAAEVFTGEMEDTKNYGAIQVALYSDQDCTFVIQAKSTPTSTWREVETYPVLAGEDKSWSFQGARRFTRVIVTNGATPQADFDLQTVFKPVYVKPSSHPIGGVVKSNDDAELVKAQITGERPDGDFGNVAVTNGNNLKVSLEELEAGISTNSNSQLNVTLFDELGIPAEVDDSTHSLQTVGYEHHEIHSGDHYYICDYQSLANAQVVDFTVVVPDVAKVPHMTFSIEGSGATSVEIHETATVDVPGSAVTAHNNNRNSVNTTNLTVRSGDTFTAEGTLIYSAFSGANKAAGFIAREREIILKQNTTYIFRMTNETALANVVTWCAEWYEHAPKD